MSPPAGGELQCSGGRRQPIRRLLLQARQLTLCWADGQRVTKTHTDSWCVINFGRKKKKEKKSTTFRNNKAALRQMKKQTVEGLRDRSATEARSAPLCSDRGVNMTCQTSMHHEKTLLVKHCQSHDAEIRL